jgi:hypothetical protein
MPSTRGKKNMSDELSKDMSGAVSKVYDWKELEVSVEFTELGKAMDDASKLTDVEELKERMKEIRRDYYHALSFQKKGLSEEGVTAIDNGEARVSNRAAIASSAADTQGITGAEKDKLIAEAEAKERAKVMDIAKKQEEVLQKKLDEAKSQRESAEKNKKDAEDKHTIAVAEAERERAEMKAELQRTRNREKTHLEAKAKLAAILANVRRKQDNDEAIVADDFGDAPAPKKRKTADEMKDDRLQKLIEKAGDEEEGHRLHMEKEEERERKAEERAAARLAEKRKKLCTELEEERSALSEQLEKVSEVREAQDEELQQLRDEKAELQAKLRRAKSKRAAAGNAAGDEELDKLASELAAEKASSAFWVKICDEFKKTYEIPETDYKAMKVRVLEAMEEESMEGARCERAV